MPLTADQVAAGISIAHSCFTQGRLKDAEILLEGLITMESGNPYLHMLLGSVLLQQGRLDDSVATFTRVIEISPEDISALTNRGEIHLKQGRLKEAAADLNRSISLDPKGEDPFANRARLLIEMTASLLNVADQEGLPALEKARQQILLQLKQS